MALLPLQVTACMPYDDSNIKKMIKVQMEKRVGFSRFKAVSAQVKDLIHRILEVNAANRLTIPQVGGARTWG